MNADDQLMLILTQPHSEGKPNPEKCNHNLSYQVPICAPSNKMRTSPQNVIVPSRFCKFGLHHLSSAIYLLHLFTQDIWGEGGGARPSAVL